MSKLLIYGANGYTGQLIAAAAKTQQLDFAIAGRNAEAINQLAAQLGCDGLVFGLDSVDVIAQHLSPFNIVIHCAGPFSVTAEPMLQACLQSQTHYLDITGEISVFERAQALSEDAKNANVVLCPGVGFDVIPTDCVASQLKQRMPDAERLTLGFDSSSGLSPGTAKTSVEGLGQGGKVRQNGVIQSVPLAYKCRTIDFGNGAKNAMTIPWGDVSTAYYSTGIPNIEVYIPISPRRAKSLRRLNWIRWLLALAPVQNYLKRKMVQTSKGPNAEQRAALKTFVWGEVCNANGDCLTARITTANGYELTYLGALEVAKFMQSYRGEGGAFTPSTLIDNQLVERIPGSSAMEFTASSGTPGA